MRITINPYFLIVLTTLIWSTSGGFIKFLQLSPSSFAFIRMLVPLIIFWPFIRKPSRKVWSPQNRLMLGASGLNVFRLYFLFTAYTYAPIGIAAIFLNTWPIFANIFSYFILKEEIPGRNIGLMFLALGGIVLINMDTNLTLDTSLILGLSAAIGAAIVNALTIVIFKHQSLNYQWQESIFYQNLVGSFVFAPFFFVINPFPTVGQISGAVSFGLLIGVIAYGFFFTALKQVKASTASLLAYVEVAGALFIGILFFGEIITWNLIIGGALIMLSTILIRK